jgi:AcrR family transcriptional regulator
LQRTLHTIHNPAQCSTICFEGWRSWHHTKRCNADYNRLDVPIVGAHDRRLPGPPLENSVLPHAHSKRSPKASTTLPPALGASEIIDVTLTMARRVGFGRLSMRQIAAKLDVSATALYYHFRDKNALLERVGEHIIYSIDMPSRRLPWRKRLKQVVLSQQEVQLAYPGLARFLLHHRESAGALRWIEMILEVLRDGGFRGQHAVRALATLSFFIHPMTLLDDRPHAGSVPMIHKKLIARRLAHDPSRHPRLLELLPQLADFSFDVYLPVALDRIIAGLASDLKHPVRSAKRRTPRN